MPGQNDTNGQMSSNQRPRIFRNGEDVPAGVCVLHESGKIGYLDDTGDCDCEDVEHGECEEHSYAIMNGNWGPVVEVIPPNYFNAVDADSTERRTPTIRLNTHLYP